MTHETSDNQTLPAEEENEFWDAEMEKIVDPELGIDDFPNSRTKGVLYGLQHSLVDPNPFLYPLIIGAAAGWAGSTIAYVVQATLIFSMLTTLIQTTYGNRLPIIQSASLADTGVMATVAATIGVPAMWMGAFIGGLIEAVVGASKVLKNLKNVITPVVSGAVITVIGIYLAQVGMDWVVVAGAETTIDSVSARFAFAGAVILFFILLTFLGEIWSPLLSRGALFFSLIAIGVIVPLTTDTIGLTNALDLAPVAEAAWFGVPTPGHEGLPFLDWPIVTGAIVAIAIEYLGSISESIGDYAATCAVSGVSLSEEKINRGITLEGVASSVSVLFGGLPMTSYSQNVGIIATTRVASRKVVAIGGIFLGLYGLVPKVGQLVIAIPQAVLGGVFLVITGMIAVAGIRTIAQSERTEANMLTAALTIAIALTLPSAASGSKWVNALPSGLEVFVSSGIVLSVVVGAVLNLFVGQVLEPFVNGRVSTAEETVETADD